MKNIFVLLLISMTFGCNQRRVKVISGLEGKTIPAFRMLLMDSVTYLNTDNISKGKPLVLFYFSPFCPYCKAQTQEIIEKIQSLRNINFCFISEFPLNDIKEFEKHYNLFNYSNVTLAKLSDTMFNKYYRIPGVPYMAIYNGEKKLKEVMLGRVSTDVIREVALDNKSS
jgi:hypothetical protein